MRNRERIAAEGCALHAPAGGEERDAVGEREEEQRREGEGAAARPPGPRPHRHERSAPLVQGNARGVALVLIPQLLFARIRSLEVPHIRRSPKNLRKRRPWDLPPVAQYVSNML